ncbi:carbamoyltransferase HypF [Marinobacterium maritimum]|uniref:Carbamoyltransferase HypF n=2 Tax=Marinobacterium maritimum TaxID=500162 RepID=A0ABN1I349_9GAMM
MSPGFRILPSLTSDRMTTILPDATTCSACLTELFDPHNRRYRYPFINCTHCGPRFSIIEGMPFDRVRTSMAAFDLCEDCSREYANPEDRRFHAQANACPACGPQLWLEMASGERVEPSDPFVAMAAKLQQGQILALKGLGGFHLACDASNQNAVQRMRRRKQRPAKALAVMFRDLDQLCQYVQARPEEAELLTSPQAPIVLMRPRDQGKRLAEAIAPDSSWLGCMLPYTPLHHLLLAAFDGPLVMTSGNRSGMPQVIDNDVARVQLADIADLLVMHDRPIVSRIDDTVMRVQARSGQAEVLRPGRGTAPISLPLPQGFSATAELLAIGGDLKNTFCLLKDGHATLSQYQGDLQQLAVYEAAVTALGHYQQLYQLKPDIVACDKHPGYFSTQQALRNHDCQLIQVQHHQAHLAACLGEHGYPLGGNPVLAICLDGTGYGEHGALWGGELLYGGYGHVERLACLKPCPMPGGETAIREPWRLLVAQLLQAGIDPVTTRDIWPLLANKPLATLQQMIEQGVNAPHSSSAGRLFDALAAALGCYAEGISYEGQAAIALESLAQRSGDLVSVVPYPFPILEDESGWQLDTRSLWPRVISDLRAGRPIAELARAFHLGLAQGLFDLAMRVRCDRPFDSLVLSGGVMQNALLADQLQSRFDTAGLSVMRHRKVPCNDSGLSLGQALVALARVQQGGGSDA